MGSLPFTEGGTALVAKLLNLQEKYVAACAPLLKRLAELDTEKGRPDRVAVGWARKKVKREAVVKALSRASEKTGAFAKKGEK